MASKIRKNCAIGVFDSGLGGLTVVKELMRQLPKESIVYFGDTARVPYGTKSAETVLRFSRENTRFLLGRGVKMVVVACNTASADAVVQIRDEFDIPVVGVIEPGARAAAGTTHNNKVGVIGTRATIESGAYLDAIQRMDPAIKVFSTACPLFVPLVEEGWLTEDVTYEVARRYLGHLVSCKVDALILGCTHYPMLRDVIAAAVGERIGLVDSAEETARETAALLESAHLDNPAAGGGSCRVFVSDTAQRFEAVGSAFLGEPLGEVQVVDQSDLPWYER